MWSCNLCGDTFRTHDALTRHITGQHDPWAVVDPRPTRETVANTRPCCNGRDPRCGCAARCGCGYTDCGDCMQRRTVEGWRPANAPSAVKAVRRARRGVA